MSKRVLDYSSEVDAISYEIKALESARERIEENQRKRHEQGNTEGSQAGRISLDKIELHEQVRKQFSEDKIAELAESLRTAGQQQAITLYYESQSDRYVVIHGERRVRAAKLLGWETIEALVRKAKPLDDERIEAQLAENVARSDLNDIEIGEALLELKKLRSYSTRELAKRVGKSQASVVRWLALLDLPDDLRKKIAAGVLPASVGYEIGKLERPSDQRRVAAMYIKAGMTRSGVEAEVKRISGRMHEGKRSKASRGRARTHSPWPVKLDGGNGLRVHVTLGSDAKDQDWSLEHVEQALRESLEEVSRWIAGNVKFYS